MNVGQDVPKLQIFVKGNDRGSGLYVPNPATTIQCLTHCPMVFCSARNEANKVRRQFSNGFPLQPSVSPELHTCAISYRHDHCHVEHCFRIWMHLDMKASPRPRVICSLEPQPANLESPTLYKQIMYAKAPKLQLPTYPPPGYQTVSTMGLFLPFPEEAPSSFINSLNHPFR
uniref:Uncharacterized protein n=1 Tax=Arundo donax TaxID=35708 RepID=A0A0A8YLQ6_ARUDO